MCRSFTCGSVTFSLPFFTPIHLNFSASIEKKEERKKQGRKERKKKKGRKGRKVKRVRGNYTAYAKWKLLPEGQNSGGRINHSNYVWASSTETNLQKYITCNILRK